MRELTGLRTMRRPGMASEFRGRFRPRRIAKKEDLQ
jgi:hypothetical protein